MAERSASIETAQLRFGLPGVDHDHRQIVVGLADERGRAQCGAVLSVATSIFVQTADPCAINRHMGAKL